MELRHKRIVSLFLAIMMSFSVLPSGTIPASAAGNYEVESNNDYSSADVLTINNSIIGQIDSDLDIDIYRLTTPSSGKLSLNFNHKYMNSGYSWFVEAYQYSGGKYNMLSKTTVSANSEEIVELPFVGTTENGIYYVKVYITSLYSDLVGKEYEIESKFLKTEYCEKELNDSYDIATNIALNESYGGCINSDTDVDIYKLTTPSGGKLSLNFNHKYMNSGYSWFVEAYQYSGGKYNMLSKTTVSANSEEIVELPFVGTTENGIYYVKVYITSLYSDLVGKEYSLITNYYPDDSIKPTGSISSTNNVASSQTVTLNMSDNIEVAGYYWGTSSSYGNNAYTEASSSSVTKTISNSGTYYLTVKDTSGNLSTTYSVTFYKTTLNANGGTVLPSYIITKSGNSFAFPTPCKSNYTYNGWSTSSSASSGIKTITPTGNSTYYAVWNQTSSISGQCGDSVYYELDLSSGHLNITGQGNMWNWTYNNESPWYNEKVKSVDIEEGVTSVGERAFYQQHNLTNISFPDTLITIGDGAFWGADSITTINIPKNVESIGKWGYAFNNASSITNINVDPENNYFSSIDGILFNKDKTTLLQFPNGKSNDYNIPNTVNEIGRYAFAHNSNLEQVTIPSSVIKIAIGAFCDCDNIKEITVPKSVSEIGRVVFSSCYSLERVNVLNSNVIFDVGVFDYSDSVIVYGYKDSTAQTYANNNDIHFIALDAIELSSISIVTQPSKKVYYIGDSLDTSGLQLKLTYSDGSTETVSSGYTTSRFSSTTAGTKTVTVTYEGLTTTFNVTVNTPSISLPQTSKTMTVGDTARLTATTTPSGQSINWASSNTSVATVSNGVVTAKARGTSTITAKFTYNGIIYSSTFTVSVVCLHSYSSEITKSATCTSSGTRTYACIICGDSYTETISALGHNYISTMTPPTCTIQGYTEYKCTRCDSSYMSNFVSPTGHNFSADCQYCKNGCGTINPDYSDKPLCETIGHQYTVTTVEPTCKLEGYTLYTCQYCHKTVKEIKEKLNHNWDSGKVTKIATCTSTGIKICVCKLCGETRNETIPATDHCYVAKVVAPTCTENGYTKYLCANCGDSYTTNFVFAIGHTYKTIITKATTSKNGSVVTKCSVCGAVKSKSTIYYPKKINLSTTSYTYDGKVKKPSVKVIGSNGKTISSSNYTVSYASGRKNVGKYSVKITFKGNYSGSKTLYFAIKPKATSISKLTASKKAFTVKWKKQSTQVTGYQIQYSTSSKFKSTKTVTVSKNSTTSKKISRLKAKKKYYVRIRTYKTVKGTKYYSAWSKAKSVTTKK